MKTLLTILIVIILLSTGYLFFTQQKLINRVSFLESQSPYFIKTIPQEAAEQISDQQKLAIPVGIGFQEISGSVSEIKDNRLKVSAKIPLIVDFSNPTPPITIERTYEVLVSKETILNKISADDPEKTTSLSGLKEIQTGDLVLITASEDLRDKIEFTAKAITIF
jgi:hypothetical protein